MWNKIRFLCAFACSLLLTLPIHSADWPAWRFDASRSAATSSKLPENLHLKWTRQFESIKPAWQEDPRIYFDASIEPIVLGKRMFVASSATDSVVALDTDTGKELWRFFTDGPIRLAPVGQKDRIWFGCDDGHVYCLHVETGSLIWKYNAAPSSRKVLGNERLIPVWPIRGGIVLDKNQLHFTVGVWPFEGTYLITLNAETGKLVSNEAGLPAIKALRDQSPQGYLALTKDRLFIPTGRGRAYCLNRETGKPVSHRCESRGLSDYHVIVKGPWIFHGHRAYHIDKKLMLPEMVVRPVIADDAFYGTSNGKLSAYDLHTLGTKTVKDRKGKAKTVSILKKLWSLDLTKTLKATPKDDIRVDLLAGNTLFGHWKEQLFAVRLPKDDEPAKVIWQQSNAAPVATMIAADDKLFVVSTTGVISSLGATHQEKLVTHSLAEVKYSQQETEANRILKQTGQTEGYCLCFGLKDGHLIEDLAKQSKLTIIAIDPDEKKVNQIRQRLHKQRLYGSRIVCMVGNPLKFGLQPYLAQLIVSEDPAALHQGDAVKQVFHCLRPYGGMACLELTKDQHEALSSHVKHFELPRANVGRHEGFTFLRRESSLVGSGDWTHEYGDAQNTLSSSDKLVKAPLGLLWFGGPAASGKLFYDRHEWGPSMAVIEGRMFLQGPEVFTAVDVYTGRILWQIKMPKAKSLGRRGNFTNIGFHFVALKDSIYLSDAKDILRLDPKTGKVINKFSPPADTKGWGRFRVWNDQLIVTVFSEKDTDTLPTGAKAKQDLPTGLVSINRFRGTTTWSRQATHSFQLFSLGANHVFCVDAVMPGLYNAWKRKGKIPKSIKEKFILALNLRTGKTAWRNPSEQISSWLASSATHGIVLTSNKDSIVARREKDGAIMWEKKAVGKGFKGHPESVWDKVIILGDRIIDQRGPGLAYELKTGKTILHRNPLTGKMEPWQFTKAGHHCNYAIANEHLMTFRAASAGFCELDSTNTSRLNGFRSGCRNSLIPANGVMNAPNMAHGCVCSYNLFTSLALVHVPEAEQWAYSTIKAPSTSLERVGINFGAPGDRLAANGTLWLDYPNVGGSSPKVNVKVSGRNLQYSHRLAEQMKGEGLRWVASSSVEGVSSVTLSLPASMKQCKVRLYFAEWEKEQVGQRVFDVKLGNQVVIEDFDVFKEAKGARRVLMKEIESMNVSRSLTLTFITKKDRPILSGIEIISMNE